MATSYFYEVKTVGSGQLPGGTYLKLISTVNSITVSGTTATANITQQLYIKRGDGHTSYGYTSLGKIVLGDSTENYSVSSTSASTSYFKLKERTINISYNASTSKTITHSATNYHNSSSISSFVDDLSVPYTGSGKTATTTSGSVESFVLPAQASAPTSPSSLKLNNSTSNQLVARNSAKTLSWSAGSSGISNTIVRYNIYRATSVNGTYNYLSYTTGTSYSVTASSSSGVTYYYKVVSVGSGGLSSGYSTASPYLKSNTTPSSPTVTYINSQGTDLVIPSAGATITFSAIAGASNDSGQSSTAQYKKNDGSWTTYNSSSKPTMTSAGTIYFRTYDGIEYSSIISRTVTSNTRSTPSGTATATDSPTTGSNISKNVNVVITNIKKGDVLRFYIKRASSLSGVDGAELTLLTTQTSSGTSYSTNLEIPNYCSADYFGKYYKLYVTASDSYDTSSVAGLILKSKNNTTLSSLYFGATPQLTSVTRNGSGTNGYFYNSIKVQYSNNPLATSLVLYYNNTPLSTLSRTGEDIISINENNTTGGASYSFKIVSTLATQTISTTTENLTRASFFSFSNTVIGSNECFLLETENGANSISQTFSFLSTVINHNCLDSFSSSENNGLKYYLEANNGTYTINANPVLSINGNTATITTSSQNLYSMTLNGGSNPLNLVFNTTYSAFLYAEVTNSFGMVSTSPKIPFKLSLKYSPKITTAQSLQYNLSLKENSFLGYSNSSISINENNLLAFRFKPPLTNNNEQLLTTIDLIADTFSESQNRSLSISYTRAEVDANGYIYMTSNYAVPPSLSKNKIHLKLTHKDSASQQISETSNIVFALNQLTQSVGEVKGVSALTSSGTITGLKVSYLLNSLGGEGYLSSTSSSSNLWQAFDTFDIMVKTLDSTNWTIISYKKTGSNLMSSLLNDEEKTINITLSASEQNLSKFIVEFKTIGYVNKTDQTNSTSLYRTPIQETVYSNQTFFYSTGAPLAYYEGGASVNSRLNDDEAFSVGGGVQSRTKINLHGLKLIDVIIDCGTW